MQFHDVVQYHDFIAVARLPGLESSGPPSRAVTLGLEWLVRRSVGRLVAFQLFWRPSPEKPASFGSAKKYGPTIHGWHTYTRTHTHRGRI